MTGLQPSLAQPRLGGAEPALAALEAQVAPDLLRFHHLGLAVADPAAAFRVLAFQNYREGAQVYDPNQKVHLAMRHHTVMPDFEVIWPGAEPSPIDAMVKRSATRLYHCCYETEDVDLALRVMARGGLDIVPVSPPKPALLFGGRHVSFVLIEGFGLIELLGRF